MEMLRLVLSIKKWYSSFIKKVLVFEKTSSKVEISKMFKIPSDCCLKTG